MGFPRVERSLTVEPVIFDMLKVENRLDARRSKTSFFFNAARELAIAGASSWGGVSGAGDDGVLPGSTSGLDGSTTTAGDEEGLSTSEYRLTLAGTAEGGGGFGVVSVGTTGGGLTCIDWDGSGVEGMLEEGACRGLRGCGSGKVGVLSSRVDNDDDCSGRGGTKPPTNCSSLLEVGSLRLLCDCPLLLDMLSLSGLSFSAMVRDSCERWPPSLRDVRSPRDERLSVLS